MGMAVQAVRMRSCVLEVQANEGSAGKKEL